MAGVGRPLQALGAPSKLLPPAGPPGQSVCHDAPTHFQSRRLVAGRFRPRWVAGASTVTAAAPHGPPSIGNRSGVGGAGAADAAAAARSRKDGAVGPRGVGDVAVGADAAAGARAAASWSGPEAAATPSGA